MTTIQNVNNGDSGAVARGKINSNASNLNTDKMETSTYDPTAVGGDAFSMGNMAETATEKILTADERADITANTAAKHTQGTDTALDTGGANEVSAADIKGHIDDTTTNPHAVDKTDVGLGNVDNTSDADKPISTATQSALDDKADDADVLKKASNLSDVADRQTALDSLTDVASATDEYVLKKDTATGNAVWKAETGGGASTFTELTDTPADYTGHAGKVATVNAGEDGLEFTSVSGTGDMTRAVYDPTAVGGDAFSMGNMAETATEKILTDTERTDIANNKTHALGDGSDHADVASNTAVRHTQGTDTALDAGGANEVSAADIKGHIDDTTTNPHAVDKTDVGLGNVDNTADADKPISTATQSALDDKADDADVLKKASNLSDVSSQQTALNNITAVSGATNEHVLTKDTTTGNAIWKAVGGGSSVDVYNMAVGTPITMTADSLVCVDNTLLTDGSINISDGRTVSTETTESLIVASGESVSLAGGAADISSAVDTGESTTVPSQATAGFMFDSGNKMVVLERDISTLREYSLSTPYDVSTSSATGKTVSLGSIISEVITPWGLSVSSDGSYLFVPTDSTMYSSFYRLDFGTNYDISTLSYNNNKYDASEDTRFWSASISSDGNKLYAVAQNNTYCYEYTLSTPYDLTTASYSGHSLDLSVATGLQRAALISNNGKQLYVTDLDGGDQIDQYDLSTAYDLSSATCYSSLDITTSGMFLSPNECNLYIVASSSVGWWTLSSVGGTSKIAVAS